MARQNTSPGRAEESGGPPSQDPWRAFSYVLTGVLVYGLAGWGLDKWWGTSFMVGLGIVLGAVLGLYLTWKAFAAPTARDDNSN